MPSVTRVWQGVIGVQRVRKWNGTIQFSVVRVWNGQTTMIGPLVRVWRGQTELRAYTPLVRGFKGVTRFSRVRVWRGELTAILPLTRTWRGTVGVRQSLVRRWTGTLEVLTPMVRAWRGTTRFVIPQARVWQGRTELLARARTLRRFRGVHHLLGAQDTHVSWELYAQVGRTRIEVQACQLRADWGSPYWQAEINLSNAADYARFPLNQPFTLHYCGVDYALIVDQPDLNRSIDDTGNAVDSSVIRALSPAAMLDFPRAEPLSQSWTTPINAKAAVTEILGQSLDWNMIDWSIPGNRLALVDASPMQAAQNIIQAAGGVLLSLPDGQLRAQPRFTRTMPDLYQQRGPVDLSLDAGGIFSVSQSIVAADFFNVVRVIDVEGGFQDKLEFVADPDNGLWGTLYAYPSPWREDVTVQNTRGPVVRLYPQGVQTREESETIDVLGGEGTVKYPILAILETHYEADNLGGVAAELDSVIVRTAKADYSRLFVRYRTRAFQYRAQSSIETAALMTMH